MGHYLGSLLPRIDTFTNVCMPPKFAQIYIVDPDMQQRAERRRGIFADLDSGTLLEIEQMMEECNAFAQQYLNFAEKLRAATRRRERRRRRRRPPGVLKFKGREYDNATINQWVVPYNPYLSQKYNCHINVEVGTALTAVKYLYKYVYEGSDKTVITVETVGGESRGVRMDPDEILRYLNVRYIFPIETCMRLLGFSVQGKTHSIVQLTIHLENEQFVTSRSSDNPDRVLTRGCRTMLTRFVELCTSEAPENQVAKTMVYQDIPKLFRWDDKAKKWVRRKQYQAALGRMVHVTPRDMEKFYMRVLLCHSKGPQSFAKLRTVDGVTYASYRQAALKLGYLEDDAEWIACMEEAAAFKMPYQLRQLFATSIVYSQVSEVRVLWNRFYEVLSEDFAYTYRGLEGQEKEDMIRFHTLKDLNDLLQISG
ncbi:helitron helicase-like protein [Phytophthora cinnamomi]|uniref:helitron helicase-like protein n=1 Tax=Phytophthora cinnamomi TaxID=4785 RepID=UPI00355A5ECF|nr:helitron helicase-like protein [Phytophthora cinnamomi]